MPALQTFVKRSNGRAWFKVYKNTTTAARAEKALVNTGMVVNGRGKIYTNASPAKIKQAAKVIQRYNRNK